MSDLRVFFDERKSEVDVYFNFIKNVGIDRINHKTIKFDAKTNFQTTDDLKKVLKSNCILILYNLIEGVVTKSVEFIIDKINDQQIEYKDLIKGIKYLMLRTSSKQKIQSFEHMNKDLVGIIDNLFNEVFNVTFDREAKKRILGGGGDFNDNFINEISKKLDISFSRTERTLSDLKIDRNDLAHGSKSYIECSQNKTFSDIKKQKTKVFKYLDYYVKAVEKFIEEKKYKIS